MNPILVRYLIALMLLLHISLSSAQNYEKISSLKKGTYAWQEPEKRIISLLAISREFENYQIDSALNYATQANLVAMENKIAKGRVNSLVQLGRVYLMMGNYDQAVESSELAIELAVKHDMKNEEAIASGVLAFLFADIGDYDKSAQYNFKSLKLFEETGNTVEIGITYGNIAADMLVQKNYSKALDYMHKALKIAESVEDKPGIAQQYNNIAGLYFNSIGNYTQALEYYAKSLQVNREINDQSQIGVNLLNIGYCWFRLKKIDSARIYFNRANDVFVKTGSSRLIANGELALANYYNEIHNYNESLVHSIKALNLGKQTDSKETIAEASEIIYKTYLIKGDTIRAFRYSDINYRINDTLQNLQSQKTLFKLEYQYNYEKRDKERQLKAQRNYYIMGFIILGLLSFTGMVLLFYSRQKIKIRNSELQKQKIAADLNFKNKELTINLMALMKKNELLADVSKKLIKIEKNNSPEEISKSIKSLNKEIRQTTDDKIWKEFSLRFNQTNSEFYDSLTSKYPDLTQNELKLCAYLRLNMTSKEIAELTGQRILTLENARYRLRKKLGITGSDTNLVNFLSQL